LGKAGTSVHNAERRRVGERLFPCLNFLSGCSSVLWGWSTPRCHCKPVTS